MKPRPFRSRLRYVCRAGRRSGTHHWFTVRLGGPRRKVIRCSKCRSTDVLYAEDIYLRAQQKRADRRCTCDFVPHPHWKGTHQLCQFYDHGPMTDELAERLHDMSVRLFSNPTRTAFS